MEKYIFKEYSKDWKKLFSEEKRFLKTFLKNVKIEHIGSTSVPGLGGKGIIDILVGVKKEDYSIEKKLLEKNGYEYRENGSCETRAFFRRLYKKEVYHLHLVVYDEIEWLKGTAFRDYLIENPQELEEYALLKKKAVKIANGDGEIYREYKRNYIEKTVKSALRQSAKLY